MTIELIECILFGGANRANRELRLAKCADIMEAFRTGKWVNNWFDPLLIDWNWLIVSGQKRLFSYYILYHSGELDPKYKKGFYMRVNFGYAPDVARKLADNAEERTRKDQLPFSDNKVINQRVHEAITLAAKLHCIENTAALRGIDSRSIFSVNEEGFLWAASLPKSKLNTAPLRLALAEAYKLESDLAIAFANEFFDIDLTATEPVPQAKLLRAHISRGNSSSDQRIPYEKAVGALQSWMCGVQTQSIPRRAQWRDVDKRALNYPVLKPLGVVENTKTVAKELQKLGFKNTVALLGAIRLVCSNNFVPTAYIKKHAIEGEARWKAALNHYNEWRLLIPYYSWAAVIAFCYQNPNFVLSKADSSVVAKINEAAVVIKRLHASYQSVAAREDCLKTLYRITGISEKATA